MSDSLKDIIRKTGTFGMAAGSQRLLEKHFCFHFQIPANSICLLRACIEQSSKQVRPNLARRLKVNSENNNLQ